MQHTISLDAKSIGGIRTQNVIGAANVNPIESPIVPSGINKLILGLSISTDDVAAGRIIEANYQLTGAAGPLWIPLNARTITVANTEWLCAINDFWLPSGWKIQAHIQPALTLGCQITMVWGYIDVLQI